VTLVGVPDNDNALVIVNGGELVMVSGAIRGNGGGSVRTDRGTLTMLGGFVEGREIQWTLATQSQNPGFFVYSVAYGNGKFIAVGVSFTVPWSAARSGYLPDGVTRMNFYDNTVGRMAYSTDGVNWTEDRNNATNGYGFNSITFCGGRFFKWGPPMMTSTDGVNWTVVYNYSGDGVNGVAYGNGKYVFVTYQGIIMHSTDGITWTAAAGRPSGIQYQSIGFGSGRFIAADDTGRLAYSTDGVTWTVAPGTHGNVVRSVVYANGRFVRSGWSHITYSEDGLTWGYAELAEIFGDDAIWRVTYGGGKFVAVSRARKMAYSTDSVTWTAVDFDAFDDEEILDIAYGNGRFVIVGADWAPAGEMNKEWKIAYSNVQE
jgi:hypothetical protein